MNPEVMRYIHRLFEKHSRKMRNIVARGEVSMVQDGPMMQTNQIKVLDGELIDGAERAQQYGFTSHPQGGAECFVVFADGDRSHPIILSVDDRRYRVKSSKAGEVVIYTDEGDMISLKRDNTIEVTTKHLVVNAEEDVTYTTKAFTINTESFDVFASDSAALTTPDLGLHADSLTATNRMGEAATATFKGNLDQDGEHSSTGDQKAGTISQMHHQHDGIQPGDSNTGEPVP